MKTCLWIVALCFMALAAVSGNNPANTSVWEDSVVISGTASDTLPVIWTDKMAEKTLLIEGKDTSAAGFASDSACVSVKVMQVWPVTLKGVNNYFVLMNSRAHPDSTTNNGGTIWTIADSIRVQDMCTTCVFIRNRVTVDQRSIPGDSILAKSTNTSLGAFWYAPIAPDASPAIALIVTGKANNKKASYGSRWRFRISGVAGSPVRGN